MSSYSDDSAPDAGAAPSPSPAGAAAAACDAPLAGRPLPFPPFLAPAFFFGDFLFFGEDFLGDPPPEPLGRPRPFPLPPPLLAFPSSPPLAWFLMELDAAVAAFLGDPPGRDRGVTFAALPFPFPRPFLAGAAESVLVALAVSASAMMT